MLLGGNLSTSATPTGRTNESAEEVYKKTYAASPGGGSTWTLSVPYTDLPTDGYVRRMMINGYLSADPLYRIYAVGDKQTISDSGSNWEITTGAIAADAVEITIYYTK